MLKNSRHVLLINYRYFHSNPIQLSSDLSWGLNKVEFKHLKHRIEKTKSELKPKHFYQEIFKINNKYDLAKELIESEVHHEVGKLIGLVKPYGIRRYKKSEGENSTLNSAINLSGQVSSTSIEEVLPLLREHYNEPKLEVVFTPERFTTGVLLLGYKPSVNDTVKKSFRRSVGLKKSCQTYLTVVHGQPVPETTKERVCSHYRYIQNVGAKLPVIKKNPSITETKKGLVTPNIVEHSVLAHHKENDVSLVELKVVNDKNHFIRVWLAHCCSPILGDRMCGGRVKTVFGKRMPVNPSNYSSYLPPEVPSKLLEKLHLSPGQVEIIPPHIHLSKIELISRSGEPTQVISANPPDYFYMTCKQLSLINDDEEIPSFQSRPVDINDIVDIEEVEEELFTE